MKFERDHVRLRTFEQYILTGSETRKFATQNQASLIQLAGNGRLSKHEQRLQDATLSPFRSNRKEGSAGRMPAPDCRSI